MGWSKLPKALWEILIGVTSSGSEFRTLTSSKSWAPFSLIFPFRLMCLTSTNSYKVNTTLGNFKRDQNTNIFSDKLSIFFTSKVSNLLMKMFHVNFCVHLSVQTLLSRWLKECSGKWFPILQLFYSELWRLIFIHL